MCPLCLFSRRTTASCIFSCVHHRRAGHRHRSSRGRQEFLWGSGAIFLLVACCYQERTLSLGIIRSGIHFERKICPRRLFPMSIGGVGQTAALAHYARKRHEDKQSNNRNDSHHDDHPRIAEILAAHHERSGDIALGGT